MPEDQKMRVRRTPPLPRGEPEEIPFPEPKAHCKASEWAERSEELNPEGEIETDSEEEDEEDETMGIESEDSDSSEDEEDLMEDSIKTELSTLSFTELQQLQNRVGMKAFNQMLYRAPSATQSTSAPGKAATQSTSAPGKAATQSTSGLGKAAPKRTNKNRPLEMSAKQRVPFLRKVVPVKKQRARDPRFDDLSGEYKPSIFEKTYAFLDDMKKEEKEMVKKQLNKVQDPNRKQELEQLLQRMNNQEDAQSSRRRERERHLQFKRQQRERVRQGSKPFHLTKSAQREMELAEKYRELKRSGKLESFLGKKRKRNAVKDRRRMPTKQPA
eukprot:gi/632987864/ref/XP_007882793.1/ PREDICTED: ribosomal RNA processing protein 36 homolog [Callorhinchus milii]